MFNKRPYVGPRKTSIKEVVEKNVSSQSNSQTIDVMAILAERHPVGGEDFAIQMWCKANNHNPFFKVQSKQLAEDLETASLVINNQSYEVNIRTGVIINKGYSSQSAR